jgi:hypothetical protein
VTVNAVRTKPIRNFLIFMVFLLEHLHQFLRTEGDSLTTLGTGVFWFYRPEDVQLTGSNLTAVYKGDGGIGGCTGVDLINSRPLMAARTHEIVKIHCIATSKQM